MGFPPELYHALTYDSRISNGAFRLWHVLRDMCGSKTFCWPSQRHLMTKLKAGPNSICEWTQELQKLGYVEIESRGYKKSNAYHITIPKELIINCATETITQEPSVLSKNGFCATENVNSALFKTSTEPNSVEPNKRTKRQRVFIQEYGREMSSDEISAGCVVKEGLLYEADGETRRDYSSKTYRGM